MDRIIIILIVLINLSCEKAKAQIDFIDEIDKNQFQVMSTNSLGMIGTTDWYNPNPVEGGEQTNIYGEFTISMIHKDGGQEWVMSQLTKSTLPCPSRYGNKCGDKNVRIAAHRLLIEDKAKLNEFAKWAFYIDKQYLFPFTEEAEGGTSTSYFTKENTKFEVVLYQQLPGETVWTEIDRRMVNDDEYLDWESSFKKAKAKEYN
jgi:hypothetical protein